MTFPTSFLKGLRNALSGFLLGMLSTFSAMGVQAAEPYEDRDTFLNLLSMVPDISETSPYEDLRTAQFPTIWMVAYRTAEQAVGVPTPHDWSDLKTMDEASFSAWASAVSRFRGDALTLDMVSAQALLARSAPSLSPKLAIESQGLPAVLGIEWFSVAGALTAGCYAGFIPVPEQCGRPDIVALRFEPDFPTDDLASTLPSRGFAKRSFLGVNVWHRLEDGALDEALAVEQDVLGSRWVDPFGVTLGSAARIATVDSTIFGSPYWGITELMVGTALGEIQPLAAAPDFLAAVEALTDHSVSNGSVIQMAFFNRYLAANREVVAVKVLGPYSSEERRRSFLEQRSGSNSDWGSLPAYRLIALADRQDGEEELAVMALVYDDPAEASAAARIVGDRIRKFEFPSSKKQWFGRRGAVATQQTYDAAPFGRSVAIVTLRFTPQPDPEIGLKRGQLFVDLFRHFVDGAVDFLLIN
jgi:hypothetical protein